MQAQLAEVPNLQVAFLCRKVLPNGDRRHVMVAFHKKKAIESEVEPQKLVQALVKLTAFPDRTMIFSPKTRKDWTRRMDGIPGTKIFERTK